MTLCRQTNQLAPVPANADASQIVFESATNQPEAVLYDHVHQGHRTITMPNHLPTARPTLRCYRVARAAAADADSPSFVFSDPCALGRAAPNQPLVSTILPSTEPAARSSRACLASRSANVRLTRGSIFFSARSAKILGRSSRSGLASLRYSIVMP